MTLTLLHLLFATQIAMASPRTVMVQMFEWPWHDVARECEVYLGPNGFSAVQVSPPEEHVSLGKNNWWERYQPVSYKIFSRSGDEAGFKDMVQRCHNAGVDIYADVVLNHMAAKHDGACGFAGSSYVKYTHPGIYQRQDFHDCGRNGNDEIRNYKDRFEVQFCELVGLADLKTESEYVRNTLADYLNHLLDLGVAGFRLDSAKHMPAEDIQAIVSRLKRHAYIVSETFIGSDEPITVNEYMGIGGVNYFPYAFDMGNAMSSGHISHLPETIYNYPDSRYAVVFVENHDLQRMDSTILPGWQKDQTIYKLANVFLLTWPYGYPQVFSGYTFHSFDEGPPVNAQGWTQPILNNDQCTGPWNCEHRMQGMPSLVRFHNETDAAFYASKIWRGNDAQLAFSRGKLGFVAINRDGGPMVTGVPTDLPDGWYCNLMDAPNDLRDGRCNTYVQVKNGVANLKMPPNSAVVLLASSVSIAAPFDVQSVMTWQKTF